MKTLGEIICKYRKQNNLSQTELANLLSKHDFEVGNKAISSWEKNTTAPGASLLLFLCKLLGITDLYGEYYGTNPDDPFLDLNEEGKEKALDYIQLLTDSGKYKKATIIPFTRTLRLYDIPASAGLGSFLDGEHFTEVEVGEEVPSTADFGIRISGNSMEPRFVDGQIVWVHKQNTLMSGEIGIFFLDGNAYCKKLEDNAYGTQLISLNTTYEPITVNPNQPFRIFGKVVG